MIIFPMDIISLYYRLTFYPLYVILPAMKQILPIIIIILALTGAITYSIFKRPARVQPINNMGISANQLENSDKIVTPTPSESKKVTFGSLGSSSTTPSITPSVTPSVTPTTVLPETIEKTNSLKASAKAASQTITKTTVCTPVYGAADTCTEHVVVDTGAENAVFFNFAGLAYLGGLLSFVKAKSLKK